MACPLTLNVDLSTDKCNSCVKQAASCARHGDGAAEILGYIGSRYALYTVQ